MGKQYDRLDIDERYELHRLDEAGKAIRESGRLMGRSASTIGACFPGPNSVAFWQRASYCPVSFVLTNPHGQIRFRGRSLGDCSTKITVRTFFRATDEVMMI